MLLMAELLKKFFITLTTFSLVLVGLFTGDHWYNKATVLYYIWTTSRSLLDYFGPLR